MSDISQLAFAINKFAKETRADFDRISCGAMLQLQRKVVDDTAKDTGLAQSNWQIGINELPNTSVNDIKKSNMRDAQTAVAKALGGGERINSIHLTNNLTYIRVLEYGGYPNPPKTDTGKTKNGFSTQSPKGMLRKNVLELTALFENEAAKAKK